MKLNKLERYTAYCILLAEMEYGWTNWICTAALFAFDISLDDDLRFTKMKTMMPELWGKRLSGRTERSPVLWNSANQRIAALKACIEETHP